MNSKVAAAGVAFRLLVVVCAGAGCEDPPADGFLELSIVARNEGAADVAQLRVAPSAVHVVWSDSPAGERHILPLELGEPLVLDLHFVDGVARQKVTLLSAPVSCISCGSSPVRSSCSGQLRRLPRVADLVASNDQRARRLPRGASSRAFRLDAKRGSRSSRRTARPSR